MKRNIFKGNILILLALVFTLSLLVTPNKSQAQITPIKTIDSSNMTVSHQVTYDKKIHQLVIANNTGTAIDSFEVYGVYAIQTAGGQYTHLDTVDVASISADLGTTITNVTNYIIPRGDARSFKLTDPEQYYAILVKALNAKSSVGVGESYLLFDY